MKTRKNWGKKGIPAVLTLALSLTAVTSIGTYHVEASQFTESKYDINMSYFDSSKMEIANGWTNGDMFNCMWRSDNIAFSDDIANLSITKDTVSNSGYSYAGGEYRTTQTFGYGYYEVTMKPIKNTGVVSSFFTYTGPTDGTVWDEIDIEFLGKDTTKVQFNYFTNSVGGHECLYSLGFDASEDFHTYGFEWQPDYITWYVDGTKVHTATSNIPRTPGKIMMNVWPGTGVDDWLGAFDGATPLTAQYAAASYSRTAPGSSTEPTPTPEPSVPPKPSDGKGILVEAENYANMSGIQTEECSEGGRNVSYIDTYDWMSYDNVDLPVSGTYLVEFRVASINDTGILRLEQDSGNIKLGDVSIPNTGDWQNWTTVSMTLDLNAGSQTFGIAVPAGGYNLNWIKFTPVNTTEEPVFPYVDVPEDSWYYDYAFNLYKKGIMTGMDETHFGPETMLNRGQFAVILHRLANKPAADYSPVFLDIPDNQFYTNAVLWASKNGIVTGFADSGLFKPDDSITREQMAVMMYRYARYLKADDLNVRGDLTTFKDSSNVSEFAEEAMEWAVGTGLLSGTPDGTLMPQGTAVRAECAAVISRFMDR